MLKGIIFFIYRICIFKFNFSYYQLSYSAHCGNISGHGQELQVLILTILASISFSLFIAQVVRRITYLFFSSFGCCLSGWFGMSEIIGSLITSKPQFLSFQIKLNFIRIGGSKQIMPRLCMVLRDGGRTLCFVWVSTVLCICNYCFDSWFSGVVSLVHLVLRRFHFRC